MTQDQINISHMQCWLFRLAQSKWNQTPEETSELFKQFQIFDFIAECYDILHLSSYTHALNEIEAMLSRKGVAV